jgi:hypothetical protein
MGRLGLGWQPTVKTGALSHGARAGAAAVASRIPSVGRHRTVGEMAEMHTSGSGVQFWGVDRGEIYRETWSMAVGGRSEGNNVEGVAGRGDNRLGARRQVWSTGGAHGGVGGVVPWPEVPGDGGAPVDTAAASDTLPGATALLMRQS